MKRTTGAIITLAFVLGIVAFIRSDAASERRSRQGEKRRECEQTCLTNNQKCFILSSGINDVRKKALAISLCNGEKDKCIQSCAGGVSDAENRRRQCEKNCNEDHRDCEQNAARFKNERVRKLVLEICRDEKQRCARECR